MDKVVRSADEAVGVLDVTGEGLVLVETAPGVAVDEIVRRTAAPIGVKVWS